MRDRTVTHFVLDTPEPVPINSSECYLKGWWVPAEGDPMRDLVVRVDGANIPVLTGVARKDVADNLQDPAAATCGFVARFKYPTNDPRIRLVAKSNNSERILATTVAGLPSTKNNSKESVRGTVATYDEWLRGWEPDLFWKEKEVSSRLPNLSYRPLISLIMPTRNANPYLFCRATGSVLAQLYPSWELCIVDDCSNSASALEILAEAGAKDSRMRTLATEQPSGVVAACNWGLDAVQGDFVAFLRDYDELHPHALLEIVRLLNSLQDVQIVYSDHDMIDLYGVRSRPAFKPNFDMDMLLSGDYICQLTVYRRSLVMQTGGYQACYEGLHNWDLLIRAAELAGRRAIQHVPKPLYHQREEQGPPPLRTWDVLSNMARKREELISHLPKLPVAKECRVGVFTRIEDGGFQVAALGGSFDPQRTTFYEISGSFIHRNGPETTTDDQTDSPLASLEDLREDVLIFINRPLDSINHFFIRELATQALRDDCGLVTGLSINTDRKIVHSGFLVSPRGELVDPFSGLSFVDKRYSQQWDALRSVEAISDEFFCVRRNRLGAVGGLAAVSSNTMPQLVSKLARAALQQGLLVLVTHRAIATFDGAEPSFVPAVAKINGREAVAVNPNLAAFRNFRVEFGLEHS